MQCGGILFGFAAFVACSDEPDKHPDAYLNYTTALCGVATSVSGKPTNAAEIKELVGSVVSAESESAQKAALADAARSAGGRDLVNAPASGCEAWNNCIIAVPRIQPIPSSLRYTV